MPRYFIDLKDPSGTARDESGADYPHLEDALDEAKASARDLVKQYMDDRRSINDTCVEIRDTDGRVVASLTVAEVLVNPVHPAFKNNCSDTPSPGHR